MNTTAKTTMTNMGPYKGVAGHVLDVTNWRGEKQIAVRYGEGSTQATANLDDGDIATYFKLGGFGQGPNMPRIPFATAVPIRFRTEAEITEKPFTLLHQMAGGVCICADPSQNSDGSDRHPALPMAHFVGQTEALRFARDRRRANRDGGGWYTIHDDRTGERVAKIDS